MRWTPTIFSPDTRVVFAVLPIVLLAIGLVPGFRQMKLVAGIGPIKGTGLSAEIPLGAQPLTRSGFKHILKKHVPVAAQKCPSLKTKRISPHVCRHTCALNTLRATGDIRKVALWLGHESIQSTEVYLRADPSEKREMLEAVLPPTLKRGSFRPADKLIASFRGK